MRNVTDPYLLSAGDDAPVPEALAGLARRMGLLPDDLDDLDRQAAARREADDQAWGDLAGQVAGKLTAAGFRRHDPFGPRGGFGLSLWEDGVIVAWSTTEYPEDSVSPFEEMVERAMHPALEQILQASGFTARIVPQEEDNGGAIRVTGWQGPASTDAAADS